MTDAELLTAVKAGMTISGTFTDNALLPKVLAAKQYMLGGGVTIAQLESSLGIATLTVGVTDLWNLSSGEVKFSAAFHILLTQLAMTSSKPAIVSVPLNGATGAAVDVTPTLTLNNMISAYSIKLVKVCTLAEIPITITLDLTKKILTIAPDSNLDASTQYAIVIDSITDDSGRKLKYTVIQFTTAG